MTFIEKLNKKEDGSSYVIEEMQTITSGVYAAYLEHDNVTSSTVKVFTGPKYTGEEIATFALSTDIDAPWKTYIKVYAGVSTVYITYETAGDTVEAEDINVLQDAAMATQEELDAYEVSNDAEVNSLKNRMNTVETTKADETSVASRLLLKADKSNTYTKTETDARIEAVVAAAPAALDTLKEIATALNNDADFAGTMTTQLATKVDKVTGKGLSTEDYTTAEKTKLAGIEASAEVNNISDVNASLLTGSADTTLHYHTSDRNRSNHTGTQTASTISDFVSAVRAVVLTGLSTATNAAVAATDTVLSALGKLQAQITANLATLTSHISNVSNPHSVTKDQVGLGNCDNTADVDKPVSTVVQAALDSCAPTSHASTASTYGLGTTANYGHVKTINALTQSSHTDGTALSAYQGYLLNTNKAPLASPAFTGAPTAPTAATGTNTTQLASTAFVKQEIAAAGYISGGTTWGALKGGS